MRLPAVPQPIEVSSHDKSIIVGVTDWGYPNGIQLAPVVFELDGADLAARVLYLYELARTIALAVRNVKHHRETGNWFDIWPTPAHAEQLEAELSF